MIDPVIFSINILGITIALRWYGVIIMAAVVFATWLTARRYEKKGGNPEWVWDALIVVLVAGILGARLWYVINATLGGSSYYVQNPLKILAIPEGGLHIYGAFVLGGLAAYFYARRKKADLLLLLDSVAPAILLGQGLARPVNFINQELYGPPTDLPWGISILPEHRLPAWSDLAAFPYETTRFHPTFAYEMTWNLLAAAILLWLEKRLPGKFKPGVMFLAWLLAAGVGRFLMEAFFRPDQPKIPGTPLSYSGLVAGLMAVCGLVGLLARYGYLRIPFITNLREKYQA